MHKNETTSMRATATGNENAASADAPASADQLKGRHLAPEKSKFPVEVKSETNRLPTFELK